MVETFKAKSKFFKPPHLIVELVNCLISKLPVLEKANGEPVFYDQNLEPLKEECQAFINLVRQNKVPPSDGNEGLRVLRVLKEADRDLKKREKNV